MTRQFDINLNTFFVLTNSINNFNVILVKLINGKLQLLIHAFKNNEML